MFFISCQQMQDVDTEIQFAVIDAGQGLCQFLQQNSNALVFDMGPELCIEEWYKFYRKSGRPKLQSIIISHRDLDHSGGLQFLDSTVDWSGRILTSKYEDTAYIRSLCKEWPERIKIRTICEGDTVGDLPDVEILCIWPPSSISDSFPVQDLSINKYSLVFRVTYQKTSILITSDIDSASAFSTAISYKESLHSDILVVPHHGSAGSLNRIFLGYIKPDFAFISCGLNNEYNHPSEIVVGFFRTLGTELRITYLDKTVFFRSNGYFWKEY